MDFDALTPSRFFFDVLQSDKYIGLYIKYDEIGYWISSLGPISIILKGIKSYYSIFLVIRRSYQDGFKLSGLIVF